MSGLLLSRESGISMSSIVYHFGSLPRALQKAGVSAQTFRHYSEDECRWNLLYVWKHYGRRPSRNEMDKPPSLMGSGPYRHKWGSWPKAVEYFLKWVQKNPAALHMLLPFIDKVRQIEYPQQISDEQLLAEIRRVAEMSDGKVTRRLFEANRCLGSERLARARFGTWANALKLAGVELGCRQYRWTKDEYFENLLSVWTHYGYQPGAPEMNNPPSRISQSNYTRIWGNWTNSVKALLAYVDSNPSLSPDIRCLIQNTNRFYRPREWFTAENVLAEIRRVADILGGEPLTLARFKEHSGICVETITKLLGSWRKALIEAGVPVYEQRRHSEDELYDNLLTTWLYYCRQPTTDAMERPPSQITPWPYFSIWGNWTKTTTAFLERVDSDTQLSEDVKALIRNSRRGMGRRRLTKALKDKWERLRVQSLYQAQDRQIERASFENLLAVWKHLGRRPGRDEMDKPPSRISSHAYRKRWTKWTTALAAFLDWINAQSSVSDDDRRFIDQTAHPKKPRIHSDEAILEEIRRVAKITGGKVTKRSFADNSPMGAALVRKRFGSWWDALGKAGIRRFDGQKKRSKDEYFENLLAVWTHYGRQPTTSEMNKPPSKIRVPSYHARWKNWTNAVAAFLAYVDTSSDISDELKLSLRQGFRPYKSKKWYTVENMLSEIRRASKKLGGKTLTQKFFEQESGICSQTVTNRFGSWRQALKEAGLPPTRRRR